jgi:hypothetical protein
MKPNNPEHDQELDELAAGLDAGWDTPAPAQTRTSSSQPPLSIPPSGEALDALDADWDTDSSDSSPAPAATRTRGASRPRRPNAQAAVRPSQVRSGVAPLSISKQERRDAERKRVAHQAKQKSSAKQQRKAERQEEARRASELRRAEQHAQAERRAAESAKVKPAKASRAPSEPSPKRIAKQTRRAQGTESELPAPRTLRAASPVVVHEGGVKKLIPLVVIAVVVAATLCFALLRSGAR